MRKLLTALWLLAGLSVAQAEYFTISPSGGGSSGITIGTTTITSGTNTRVLFDDGGVVGESAGLTYVKASGLLASTAHAIGGATIGTDALSVTGTFAVSGISYVGSQIQLSPASNRATAQGVITAQSGYMLMKAENALGTTAWPYLWLVSTNGSDDGAIEIGYGGGDNSSKASTSNSVFRIANVSSGVPTYNFFIGNTGIVQLGSGQLFGWATTGQANGTLGTNFNRPSNGVLNLGTTTTNALGSLNLLNLVATGNLTAFTAGTTAGFNDVQLNSARFLYWSGRTQLSSPSDGKLLIENAAGTDFSLLQFGGTTPSFPSLKRNSATLAFRLADDSADAAMTAAAITGSGILSTTSTTDATAAATGSLQTAGGASVAKRVFLSGLTASAGLQTAVLCLSSANEVIADSVACLASTEKAKQDIVPLDMGLATILALKPILYRYSDTGNDRFDSAPNHRAVRAGFRAEQAYAVDPRLAALDANGQVRTVMNMDAIFAKAIQELNDKIEKLQVR